MKEKSWYENLFNYLVLILGSVIAVIGINLFLAPHTIAPGGLSGFTIVVNRLFSIPLNVTYILVNIPLLILAFKVLGKIFVVKTFIATIAFTIALKFQPGQIVTSDLLLASILGGIMNGVGIGLVVRYGGTTGGTDLIGAIVNKLVPRMKISTGMFLVDICVVVMAGLVEGRIEIALYSAIAAYVTARCIDMVLEGPMVSKTFYIITENPREIGEKIMEEVGRGITVIEGTGMYTGMERKILICVVNRTEFPRVKEIIREFDDKAFVIVNESLEVLGEGFSSGD